MKILTKHGRELFDVTFTDYGDTDHDGYYTSVLESDGFRYASLVSIEEAQNSGNVNAFRMAKDTEHFLKHGFIISWPN